MEERRENEAAGIQWNPDGNCFETDDKKSYLQYKIVGQGQGQGQGATIDLLHTYVPPSHRGKGIAARLCFAAFQHARLHSLLVIPSCSYVSETFLPKNPALKDLVHPNYFESNQLVTSKSYL